MVVVCSDVCKNDKGSSVFPCYVYIVVSEIAAGKFALTLTQRTCIYTYFCDCNKGYELKPD